MKGWTEVKGRELYPMGVKEEGSPKLVDRSSRGV